MRETPKINRPLGLAEVVLTSQQIGIFLLQSAGSGREVWTAGVARGVQLATLAIVELLDQLGQA